MNCTECDRPVPWGDWSAHTDDQHARYRHTLLRTIAHQLRRESDFEWWAWEISRRDLVGVVMSSGVYRDLRCWSEVPSEAWDDVNREVLLKFLREGASEWAQWRYGVETNPATWTYKIYDGRQT